jgi:hypothetical protein
MAAGALPGGESYQFAPDRPSMVCMVTRVTFVAVVAACVPFLQFFGVNGGDSIGFVPAFPDIGGEVFYDMQLPLSPNEIIQLTNSGAGTLSYSITGVWYPLFYSLPAGIGMRVSGG